jgi:hypothetical protein
MNIDNLSKFDFFKIEPNKENARILACSSDESKQRPIFILTRVELLDSCIIIHDDDKTCLHLQNQ